MRFLTNEAGAKSINIDVISSVEIRPVYNMQADEMNDIDTFVLCINNHGIFCGDFEDVKIRYINLIDILNNGDTPSGTFIPNNNMVVLKNDGTFEVMESSLWNPTFTKDYFCHNNI